MKRRAGIAEKGLADGDRVSYQTLMHRGRLFAGIALLALVACDAGEPSRAPVESAASVASPARGSAGAPGHASAAPSAAASTTATTASVVSLREAASRDPAAFEGTAVTLDGFFASQTQTTFGTGEFPRHHFAVVHFALARGDEDTLSCEFRERQWPPLGLAPGEAIVASGKWSFDRVLRGGIAPGGGPLHIVGCRVERRTE
jgi:hypothetical protein